MEFEGEIFCLIILDLFFTSQMYSIHWESTFLSYWWNDILKVTSIIYQKSKVVLKGIVWAMWVVILIEENLYDKKGNL